MQIVLEKSDHPTLTGDKKAMQKQLPQHSPEADKSVAPLRVLIPLGPVAAVRCSPPMFGSARFKAYIELATDAAQRWLPPEGELNQCRHPELRQVWPP
ncbi:unnamed protein product [Durusdinium trenchii]|uniref:Uncharacterized protein n=2 Tax=Durusdinium trenchii TaxID=1381693 RepID=A0ABP0PUS8_9DINO